MTQIEFIDDFLKGGMDCMNGIAHEKGQSEAYDRGYSTQYQHEQNMGAISERQSISNRPTKTTI